MKAPTIDFSRKCSLPGSLVTLRPVTMADVSALHAALRDTELAVLTGSVHDRTEARHKEWSMAELEDIYRRWAVAEDRIVWAIVDHDSGEVVGESVLNDLDLGNRSCGFRIWISGARNKGLGTEATRLTMRHAFADQGLNRVELEVYDFNPRARHVYEKVGFVHEGVKRQALRYEGGWIDAHVMSILACEWADH
ncbi:GNAT family N-acetyltransferase [Paeniglutamicibacter sp. ORCA_105]|uniref:GNAT family N-acetyltransferase n=1 Tax=Paeniglutamicibacter sp. ORCA_105 TaxID=3377336 RepID=UPI003895A11E